MPLLNMNTEREIFGFSSVIINSVVRYLTLLNFALKTSLSITQLHGPNQFRLYDTLRWFLQKNCPANAESSASVLLVQHTNFGPGLHIRQPSYRLRGQVGDQLLALPPPLAVDSGNEFPGCILNWYPTVLNSASRNCRLDSVFFCIIMIHTIIVIVKRKGERSRS